MADYSNIGTAIIPGLVANGYTCPYCGQWFPVYQTHNCSRGFLPVQPITTQPNTLVWPDQTKLLQLERDVAALKARLDELEAILLSEDDDEE